MICCVVVIGGGGVYGGVGVVVGGTTVQGSGVAVTVIVIGGVGGSSSSTSNSVSAVIVPITKSPANKTPEAIKAITKYVRGFLPFLRDIYFLPPRRDRAISPIEVSAEPPIKTIAHAGTRILRAMIYHSES